MTGAATGTTLRHYPRCFGCGDANEHGLRLDVRWDGEQGVCEHVPPQHAEGGPGVVHGGYVAAIADELMALVASEVAGVPAMTRRVELDLRAPALTGQPLVARAWVEERRRRTMVVRFAARSGDADRDCAEAKGVFVVVSMDRWIKPIQDQGRGPESVDWEGGDPSNFLRWQMRAGLDAVFVAGALDAPVRVAVHLRDVDPPAWTIEAGPDGVRTREGDGDADAHARVTTTFREWQELIHHTRTLDDAAAEVQGDRGALLSFIEAIDFRRHS